MDLAELEGRSYGPRPWRVSSDSVRDFVDLTADDVDRWVDAAPPGFAAAALFVVAPDLLAELYDRSVVHGEQTFSWVRSIPLEGLLEVTGSVTKVRERGGVFFVTFEVAASDEGGEVFEWRPLFLASGESLAVGEMAPEVPEPPQSYRGVLADGQMAASVRISSSTPRLPVTGTRSTGTTRPVSPPGSRASWFTVCSRQAGPSAAVGDIVSGVAPFSSARFRFRNPLLPARPVVVSVSDGAESLEVTSSTTKMSSI